MPNNPECSIWEDNDTFLLKRCIYAVDEEKLVYARVLLSNFSSYRCNGNGSAINIINCGFQCNDTTFIDCTSENGGGGAVYIDNSIDMINNVTFKDVFFIKCKAQYGGAVLVSLKSNQVNLTFTRCVFEYNQALLQRLPSGKNGVLFSGNAILVLSQGIEVFDCKFIQNRGSKGAVKIYIPKREKAKSVQLSENDELNEKQIIFSGCEFDQDEKSQNSISIIDQSKQRAVNLIEVSDCRFKGKLSKGTHYIDGLLYTKEKLKMASCIFESENKESPVNIFQINDDDNPQIGIEINTDYDRFSNGLYMIVFGIAFVALMCILACLIICFSINKQEETDLSGYRIFDEFTGYSKCNHQKQYIY